jgi:succinate dehydrogenase / fumarate reductase membrane anchor subunit
MSLGTPLGRVLGLGSAKDGTGHFVAQRVSAIALALLGCWFLWKLLSLESLAYLDVIRFIAQPLNGILLALLSISVTYHSYLGVQVVIEDYVHSHSLKLVGLIASRFAHGFLAVAMLYAILSIGFGT